MSWDDGKHAKVKRVELTFDDVIRSIQVEYEGTTLQSQRRGTVGTKSDGFTLSTDEYITDVSGYYRTTFSGDIITSLTFKTNKKTYGPYGNKTQHYFSASAPRDSQIAGFLGTSGNALSSIDVHFAPIPPPGSIRPTPVEPGTKPSDGPKPVDPGTKPGDGSKPDSSGESNPKPDGSGKTGLTGGKGGKTFDDGVFDGVKKITVGADGYSVTYIKIEYVKDGKVETREHGTISGELKEYSVPNYPDDYITAVGGTYDLVFTYGTTLITSLYFTTSRGLTSPLFRKTDEDVLGEEFILKGENGEKLVGFHGRGDTAIDAIGAYFDTGSKPAVPGKTGLAGGKGGKTFDDGVFDGVKKITVGADGYSVTYIKIEYVKDGKVETREHGTISGELKEYSVPNYPDDYITAVGGTYDLVFTYGTTLITSLYFTTSRGLTSPLFRKTDEDVLGEEFILKGENGEKLVGFHGRGDTAIDAIGAYFDTGSKPAVPGKTGLAGGKGGKTFDDGVFDGVKKITVGADEFSVTYIKIEYVKDGKVETREHGENRGPLKEYSVPNYPDDYITAVGGTYDLVFTYSTTLITSLYFTTSRGFTSPLFRKTDEDVLGEKFNLKGENGGKLVGLHGLDGTAINAIGAYFDTGSQGGEGGSKPDGSETNSGKNDLKPDASGKTGLVGGESGKTFDDGVFDGVKKITVGANEDNVTFIKIEYVKDGKVETREHGENRGPLKEFSVDYPKQNITAIGGSYNHNFAYDTTLITSLYFETSNGTTSPLFGKTAGENFKIKGENGEKLVGLHGRGGTAINAIGAYFDTGSKPVVPGTKPGDDSSTQKLDAQGGKGGNEWDDGGDHDGVTKIHVTAAGGNISQIRFDYLKNGQPKEGPAHGSKGRRSYDETFEIIHPKEYLVSVKGWYDSSNIIQGLQFQSSTETFGYFPSPFSGEGTEFSLEVKDKKIVGFHGFADTHVNSLGAYFAPITSTPLKPSKKLKAVGGDEGATWDDGAFDGVRKIQVGQNNDGVSFVTVEYNKGSQTVLGDGHGKKSALGVETFKLEYPGEYITAVGINYDKVQVEGRGVTLVTSLKFITNKQESPPFGLTGGEYSELKEEGHKIVGFHGKASDWIHQVGVHVAPITN